MGNRLTLQLSCTLPDKLRQVLQVIARSDTEPTHKVLGGILKISVGIVRNGKLILRTAEVGVARDSGGAVKLTKTVLGLGLRRGVESFPSEKLVGGDALLATKSGLSLLQLFVCRQLAVNLKLRLNDASKHTISRRSGRDSTEAQLLRGSGLRSANSLTKP